MENLTDIVNRQQDAIRRLHIIVGELIGSPPAGSAAPLESPALEKARQEIAELERLMRLSDSETFGGGNVL